MRIVFMGTPEFALPSLRGLCERGDEIMAVVTAPDKPRGRGQRVSFTPVKQFALQRSIPVLQPESLKDPSFAETLRGLDPDLFVVVAFRILPKEVFTLPRFGSFNLHASLLPKYRGAAPVNWAIMNGERETGVTTFFLREEVDTGSILLQARVRIGPEETAGELHDTLAEVGGEIVFQTVRLIEQGKVQPRLQSDALATPAPKIFKEHCRIAWDRPAREIHNFVRGLSPHPCAWTSHGTKTVRIFRLRCDADPISLAEPPGTILHVNKTTLIVAAADGPVEVKDLQLEGKRRMDVEEFLRGYRIVAGDTFT